MKRRGIVWKQYLLAHSRSTHHQRFARPCPVPNQVSESPTSFISATMLLNNPLLREVSWAAKRSANRPGVFSCALVDEMPNIKRINILLNDDLMFYHITIIISLILRFKTPLESSCFCLKVWIFKACTINRNSK